MLIESEKLIGFGPLWSMSPEMETSKSVAGLVWPR